MLSALLALVPLQPAAVAPWPLPRADRWATAKSAVYAPPFEVAAQTLDQYKWHWVERFLTAEQSASGAGTVLGLADDVHALGANGPSMLGYQALSESFDLPTRTNQWFGPLIRSVRPAGGTAEGWTRTPVLDPVRNRLFALKVGAQPAIVAFQVSTGSELWRRSLPSSSSAPATIGPEGDVYIPTETNVLRLAGAGGAQIWSASVPGGSLPAFTRDDRRVMVASGNEIVAMRRTDGAVLWRRDLKAAAGPPASAEDGMVVAGGADGWIRGIDPARSAVRWRYLAPEGVTQPPAIDATHAYFVAGSRLLALRTMNGSLVWEQPLPGQGGAPSVRADGFLFLGAGTKYLVYLRSGQRFWEDHAEVALGPMSIGTDGTIFSPTVNGLAVIRTRGFRTWQFALLRQGWSSVTRTDMARLLLEDDGRPLRIDGRRRTNGIPNGFAGIEVYWDANELSVPKPDGSGFIERRVGGLFVARFRSVHPGPVEIRTHSRSAQGVFGLGNTVGSLWGSPDYKDSTSNAGFWPEGRVWDARYGNGCAGRISWLREGAIDASYVEIEIGGVYGYPSFLPPVPPPVRSSP
jgi:outer membrane protein assembly factor BamB